MSQMRALLPLPVAQPVDGVLSPASIGPRPLRPGRPAVLRDGCDRCVWWRHPLGTIQSSRFRILRMSRGQWSLTVGLRCSLDLSDIGLLSGLPPAASANVGVPPSEHGLSISGGDSVGLVIPELNLRTLELTWRTSCRRRMGCHPPILVSWFLELARALLELGVLPAVVTPIVNPEVGTSTTPVLYPVPPIPVLSVVDSAPVVVASSIRPMGGAQFGMSPRCAKYRLLAPCLSRSHPRSRRRYGQRMLPDRRLGESTDSHLLTPPPP